MHLHENTLFDLDLGVKVTQNLKLLSLTVKEEMHLGQGHTKCYPVPSTSCDLIRYKV